MEGQKVTETLVWSLGTVWICFLDKRKGANHSVSAGCRDLGCSTDSRRNSRPGKEKRTAAREMR